MAELQILPKLQNLEKKEEVNFTYASSMETITTIWPIDNQSQANFENRSQHPLICRLQQPEYSTNIFNEPCSLNTGLSALTNNDTFLPKYFF